jgi:transposase
MHHSTIRKILAHSSPPGYRQSVPRSAPKLGPHIEWITALLQSDRQVAKKHRHTARRIFERLQAERGYDGGETVVKELVRELKRVSQEVFMPLSQPPGEAQVDFFEALVRWRGVDKVAKVHVFAMHLSYSDMFFLKAYSRECTEVFWDGHVTAFEFFQGVPKRISYDNLKIAVKKIVGAHERELTNGFLQLRSHYLFESHFCNVRRGNEKGQVEGLAKYARTNFMVPVLEVKDLEALNQHLFECCFGEQHRKLRGKGGRTKFELWMEEGLSPLPASPFAACRIQPGRASSMSLVRFDDNDYSVPARYAHHSLTVKGFAETVRIISSRDGEVASHVRLWDREEVSYDWRHYLPLLYRKPGSLDHAAPLDGLVLPGCFQDTRRRLESQMGHRGSKEYVSILCLLEKYPVSRLARALEKTLAICQCPTLEVAKSFLFEDEFPEAAIFRLDGRPHLAGVKVSAPNVKAYSGLLAEGAS